MKNSMFAKVFSIILLVVVMFGSMTGSQVQAAATSYKFNFGTGDVQAGYTKVSSFEAYNAAKGYGFNTPESIMDVSASGTGVASNAIRFLDSEKPAANTFNVDLPNGLYEVKVTLGDTTRSTIKAEDVYQVINMTGNGATATFQIPITDGQLNLLVTQGEPEADFTLSALEIKKISDSTETNSTIYFGGDSAVCSYYPLSTSIPCGWGQVLSQYVGGDNFQFKNMASSSRLTKDFYEGGQFAAVMKYIKPGDYFILAFGINDSDRKNDENDEEFKKVMSDMIKQVKDKGATVVLVTPQGQSTDFIGNTHSAQDIWYRHSILDLAHEESVPLVDLNVLSSAYFSSIGPDATEKLYLQDHIHLNREGASQLANIVATELKKQQLPGF